MQWSTSIQTSNVLFLVGALAIPNLSAAPPTAVDALRLQPVQAKDVDYDRPDDGKISRCRVEPFKDQAGWAVFNEENQVLRRFVDTNKDRKLDMWCYFKNGIEVYRDIDSEYDGKADQHRWLGTAGTRWGIDLDEDGNIDTWKTISPEEITAEVVAALREKSAVRFARLLLSADELTKLGASDKQTQDFRERVAATKSAISGFVKSQKIVESEAEWLQFSASRPGVIPAGTDNSTKDLLIYDNVSAILESDGKSSQIFLGTLVMASESWRIIDLPKTEAVGGVFTSIVGRNDKDTSGAGGLSEKSQKLIADLEQVDKGLLTGSGDKSKLNSDRATILEQLAAAATNKTERTTWVRQFADTVSAAVQSGDYPDGIQRLKTLLDQTTAENDSSDLIPYVKFRYLNADYGQRIATAKELEYAKVQEQWLKDLEAFTLAHSKSPETAEALLQLALGHEFAGSDERAALAYGQIVRDFPTGEQAKKASGAKMRLESVGKSITLQGKTIQGQPFDLAHLRGKTVLIQYWATWCDLCKQDMLQLKALQAKHSQKGFVVVGVNLDNDSRVATQYLSDARWPWTQVFEAGGMESRLANELGIMTLPTMILIDKSGRVIRRNVHAAELDSELNKVLK